MSGGWGVRDSLPVLTGRGMRDPKGPPWDTGPDREGRSEKKVRVRQEGLGLRQERETYTSRIHFSVLR